MLVYNALQSATIALLPALQEDNLPMMTKCVQLDLECAAICIAAAWLMSLGSNKMKWCLPAGYVLIYARHVQTSVRNTIPIIAGNAPLFVCPVQRCAARCNKNN